MDSRIQELIRNHERRMSRTSATSEDTTSERNYPRFGENKTEAYMSDTESIRSSSKYENSSIYGYPPYYSQRSSSSSHNDINSTGAVKRYLPINIDGMLQAKSRSENSSQDHYQEIQIYKPWEDASSEYSADFSLNRRSHQDNTVKDICGYIKMLHEHNEETAMQLKAQENYHIKARLQDEKGHSLTLQNIIGKIWDQQQEYKEIMKKSFDSEREKNDLKIHLAYAQLKNENMKYEFEEKYKDQKEIINRKDQKCAELNQKYEASAVENKKILEKSFVTELEKRKIEMERNHANQKIVDMNNTFEQKQREQIELMNKQDQQFSELKTQLKSSEVENKKIMQENLTSELQKREIQFQRDHANQKIADLTHTYEQTQKEQLEAMKKQEQQFSELKTQLKSSEVENKKIMQENITSELQKREIQFQRDHAKQKIADLTNTYEQNRREQLEAMKKQDQQYLELKTKLKSSEVENKKIMQENLTSELQKREIQFQRDLANQKITDLTDTYQIKRKEQLEAMKKQDEEFSELKTQLQASDSNYKKVMEESLDLKIGKREFQVQHDYANQKVAEMKDALKQKQVDHLEAINDIRMQNDRRYQELYRNYQHQLDINKNLQQKNSNLQIKANEEIRNVERQLANTERNRSAYKAVAWWGALK